MRPSDPWPPYSQLALSVPATRPRPPSATKFRRHNSICPLTAEVKDRIRARVGNCASTAKSAPPAAANPQALPLIK